MADLREALVTLRDNGIADDTIKQVADELLEDSGCADEQETKWLVLVAEFGGEFADADEATYDDCIFDVGSSAYMVLTEDEKESRWDEALDHYLEECVEGGTGPYFDTEAWKRDARMDGAGHALSSYDGNEYEYSVGSDWFYIYRVN